MIKLSIKQELAINELLKGNTIVDSAFNVNVSVPTLNRWLTQKEFKDCLNERKREVINNCIDNINFMGNKAVSVLNNILDSKQASDNVKLNASKTVIDLILKFNEQNNIIKKLEEIELFIISKEDGIK